MVGTAAIAAMIAATTVEATTTAAVEAATTTVEPASTATTVETTAASASVTAAVLGKGGHGGANECERSETCEKSLQQGGFPHVKNLHRTAVPLPGRANRLLLILPLIGVSFQARSCQMGREIRACRHTLSPYRVALAVRAGMDLEPGRSHQINPPASTRPMAISWVPVMAPPKTEPRPGSSRRYSRKNLATP
jgi:hypothetical protein